MYLFTSPASAYCVDIDANANLLLYFNNKTIFEQFKYATHVQYTALRRTAINTHSYAIYAIFRISVNFFFLFFIFFDNDLSLVNRWFFI